MYKNIFPFSCKSSFRSKRTVGNLFFCYSTAQNRLPEQYWRTFPAVLLLVSIFTSSGNSLFRLLYCSKPTPRAVLANFSCGSTARIHLHEQWKFSFPASLLLITGFTSSTGRLLAKKGIQTRTSHGFECLRHFFKVAERPAAPNPHRGCSSRNPAMRFVVTSAVVGISGRRPSAPEPAPRPRSALFSSNFPRTSPPPDPPARRPPRTCSRAQGLFPRRPCCTPRGPWP